MPVEYYFDIDGLKQIRMKIQIYQHMINNPKKYSYKDLQEHYQIPKLSHFYNW